MSDPEKVYRLFIDAETLARYLKGRRRGVGLHGNPEWEHDIKVLALMKTDKKGPRISFKKVRGKQSKLSALFGGVLSFMHFDVRYETLEKLPDEIRLAPDGAVRMEPDLAEFVLPDWRVVIQGMDEDRLHLSISRGDRLFFNGVMGPR